jgi:hypothetical protein
MFEKLTHVGLGKEATWGTAVVASDYLQFADEGMNEEIEQLISEAKRGIVDESPSFEGLHNIAGNLGFEVYPNVLGHILRAAFGAPVTTQPNALNNPTVYQHVFTPTQQNFSNVCALPPYTLEVHRDLEQAFQYAGAVLNELTLSFGNDQKIMRGSASIIAKKLALIAETTPNLETTKPFLWDQSTITIGGVANTDVMSMSFGVNNALEGRATLNATREISRVRRNGDRTFPINVTYDLIDLTEYNTFRGQQERVAKIDLIGESISGAYNFKLTVDIPKFRYTAFPINVGNGQVQAVGSAKYDAASAHAMKITLINTKSGY